MILKLREGESIEYVCKVAGIEPAVLEKENGFIPKAGQYFYIPKENVFVIKENDNLFSISKKTKLSYDEILKRIPIEVGKIFYY